MNVSSCCGCQSNSSAQVNEVSNWQQRRQSFDALAQALQSGNLNSAQQAYSTLMQYMPGASANPNSLLAQIGQALQSGDLAGAQSAFEALRAERQGHHHHHHGENQSVSQSSETTTSPSNTSPLGSNFNIPA